MVENTLWSMSVKRELTSGYIIHTQTQLLPIIIFNISLFRFCELIWRLQRVKSVGATKGCVRLSTMLLLMSLLELVLFAR